MLVLRLLVMVLTIICLMDGHAEVSSSTTAMRNGGESSSVKQNEPEVQILDRKKKKKPKPGKKKKPKPNKKKKPKPNKAKPTPTKPVTTTPTISTSTLKTTTITTTARTTTTTVSPTTTATTAKTTTSTASATTTLSTTTSATTAKTTAATSTATTTTTTISTTATTSSPETTAATTADSGAGGECKATNGKPCIFPFKDGNEEYNECKNEGGKYFWCATSVYDSGKYKHWSYCPNDGSCPIPGDEECRATNNKPCVFPFKDGNKEYNECADHGGKYFWCATGTNLAGKYTAWSECPKDGSCPLPPKITPPGATSTLTIATTTLPNTASSMPATTASPQESASTTVLVKDGEKIFSCQMDFTFESTSGFKMNSNFSSSCSPSSSTTKHYKNFDEYAFDITTSSGAEINCKINIAIQDETSGISMAAKPMEKSLDCSVDESKCVTISGEHFPTTCVVPFIHEGRKYQACTDKGGKDAGKLWCATAVDDIEEMTKWGYCSTACGYCGGKDVTDQDTRAGGACGYDCFINPYKPMEPKTQGIDPKLLSAPEVSYYDDEITVWNKLPNIQFQFLQGQPGIFLNCLDGFNHFPCHQSIYIKCDGNYRFSIYAAQLKDDNTATIGKFIKNEVKNVHIGCGPCPMGFIYKVGDEVSTYLTSLGKYNGVPDIGACTDLCNQRDCPTFVYSLEDKHCELHSVRVEKPSNPVFKDYRLCTREEENSCENSCSLNRSPTDLRIDCPTGHYKPKYTKAYLLEELKGLGKISISQCSTQCLNYVGNTPCFGFQLKCGICQLLKQTASWYQYGSERDYCKRIPQPCTSQLGGCNDGSMCKRQSDPFALGAICKYGDTCNFATGKCELAGCFSSAELIAGVKSHYVKHDWGCKCGKVQCPLYSRCVMTGIGEACQCKTGGLMNNNCGLLAGNIGTRFCKINYRQGFVPCGDDTTLSKLNPVNTRKSSECECTPNAGPLKSDCPHQNYFPKHVCDNSVGQCVVPTNNVFPIAGIANYFRPGVTPGHTNVFGTHTFVCVTNCENGNANDRLRNAWFFSLKRSMDIFITTYDEKINNPSPGPLTPANQANIAARGAINSVRSNTVIIQNRAIANGYTLNLKGICTMNINAPVYICNVVPHTYAQLINALALYPAFPIGNRFNNAIRGCYLHKIKTCSHDVIGKGHLQFEDCNS